MALVLVICVLSFAHQASHSPASTTSATGALDDHLLSKKRFTSFIGWSFRGCQGDGAFLTLLRMTRDVASLTLLLFWATCGTLRAASFQDDFVVVFIHASSETKHGPFPLDRSI